MSSTSGDTLMVVSGAGRSTSHLRVWVFLHKWTSLICTLFLLVICVTGLPLLFGEEIDHWLDPHVYESLPANTSAANLDRLVAASRQKYPGQIVSSMFMDDDEPQIFVSMVPSWDALKASRDSLHSIRFDSRNGKILEDAQSLGQQKLTFMGVMLSLHRDLFAGLPGELFLGLMGLLFVIAIVSGMVLYGPFTRRLDFGTVRRRRSPRLKWLDLHNLLGVTTLVWAFVVGATGIMNELSTPLFGLWQMTDVRTFLARWNEGPPLDLARLSSVEDAYTIVKRQLPERTVTSIVFPGSPDGSPHHYVLWSKGKNPLTAHLFNPALINANSGQYDGLVSMPWYLRALEVSRPLHFGDYGGTPLKVIWALLDLITIVVLGSGVYLWLAQRRSASEAPQSEAEVIRGALVKVPMKGQTS